MKKLLFLFFVIFISFNSSLFAQIKLDKYRDKIDVQPGVTEKGTILVENVSATEAITVNAYLEDVKYISPFDGRKEFLPLSSTPYSCGKWVTVTPSTFYLKPGGKQKVDYAIKVPPSAKGGYYGVLFFEKGAAVSAESTSVGIVLKIGCTLFLETKDKVKNVKIEDLSVNQDKLQGNFSNNGNVMLVMESSYYIIDGKGTIGDRGNIVKELYLPVGEKAAFAINNMTKNISKGSYTLVIDFSLGKGEGTLVKEIDFSKNDSGEIKIVKVRD